MPDDEVTTLLPHRDPVLCVDRLVEATETVAITEYTVRAPHTDPDRRLWAPLLIEGLAQTAAVLAGARGGGPGGAKTGLFVGARGFSFVRRPGAGETIRFRVEIVKAFGGMVLVAGEARCGGDLVAAGNLKLYLADA